MLYTSALKIPTDEMVMYADKLPSFPSREVMINSLFNI